MNAERIYRWMLSCYPAEFREEYGREMLVVFRERARAERPLPLWMELSADLLITAAKEHWTVILNDLIYATRTLRKTPAVTAAVLVTLALAIGANTAIFSVVNSVLLRPLSYPAPGRLVRIWETNLRANQPKFSASMPNFVSWRERAQSFEDLACWRRGTATLMSNGEPVRIASAGVSGSLFHTLGVQPLLGRVILPEDENPAAPPVVVITRRLWSTQFGSDPAVVGRGITLTGGQIVVAGVIPTDTEIFDDVDLFTPIKVNLAQENRGNHLLTVVGKLRPGVTLPQVRAEMRTLAANLEREYPKSNDGWNVRIDSALDWIVSQEVRRTLTVLLGAVGMVLLIACANVSNLMLSRAAARAQEMAVRSALGAARGRLLRLLFTESALLAIIGGASGVALGYWVVEAMRTTLPDVLPRVQSLAVNRPVMIFSTLITLLTGLLFGLAPAWQVSRTQLTDALKSGGRGTTTSGRWTRHFLVAGQLALATTLTAGAGLFLISLWNLRHTSLGFAPDHLLTARIGMAPIRYPDGAKRWNAERQMLEGLRGAPGIRGAGLSSDAPLTGGDSSQDMYPVDASAIRPGEQFMPSWRIVDPEYFQVMGIPLKAGRFFTEHDTVDRRALVVSEGYVRRLWPDMKNLSDAVGRQMRDGGSGLYSIVGVVGDVRNLNLNQDPRPINYFSAVNSGLLPMNVVIRTAGAPESAAAILREQVKRVDPAAPIFALSTMEELIGRNLAQTRWSTLLVGGFAVLALLLGAIGTYGVLSYAVTMRRREIGVRMALGAAAADVIRMVVREGMALAAAGIFSGIVLALALGRAAVTLLYGVAPHDPRTFLVVAAILGLVALAASAIPALRAARVDPISTLRAE
jgi:putative ABC transport system permease protein